MAADQSVWRRRGPVDADGKCVRHRRVALGLDQVVGWRGLQLRDEGSCAALKAGAARCGPGGFVHLAQPGRRGWMISWCAARAADWELRSARRSATMSSCRAARMLNAAPDGGDAG